MSEQENVLADIKHILDLFDRCVNMFELENWLKNVTVEDIKSSFKLAMFVEETIKDLQTKQCIDKFQEILILYWESKKRTKTYDIQFFTLACDHLLSKFFTNICTKANTVDIAVRMYTTVHTRDRFQNFINNLILTSASYATLVDYTIANKNDVDLKELQSRLLLNNWSTEVACGRMDDVKAAITNMLSSYNIETSVSILINILAVENTSDQEKTIQDVILKDIVFKMMDRSILTQSLWMNLIKNVEKKSLAIVCLKFKEFLKELFNFIIYMAGMMNYTSDVTGECMWISDSDTSIYPTITYNDLVKMMQFLCKYKIDLRNYAELQISEAKKSVHSKIWEELENEI